MPNGSHSPLRLGSSRSYSSTNRAFSSITLLAFHGMPSFYMPPGSLDSVRYAPGLYLPPGSPPCRINDLGRNSSQSRRNKWFICKVAQTKELGLLFRGLDAGICPF